MSCSSLVVERLLLFFLAVLLFMTIVTTGATTTTVRAGNVASVADAGVMSAELEDFMLRP